MDTVGALMSYFDFFAGTQRLSWVSAYGRETSSQDWVRTYEKALASHFQSPYASSFGSGRMALYAILKALGISAGDEVLLPAYTCVVVPNAVLYCGAVPIYVDIASDANIDVKALENKITPRTKAIIAQHTFGHPCAIKALMTVAESHGIAVIEDCAHAIGATVEGKPVGSFGVAAFASTDHTKIISTGLGGFAVTRSEALGRAIASIQSSSASQPFYRRLQLPLQYAAETFVAESLPSRFTFKMLQWGYRVRLFHYWRDELATQRPSAYPAALTSFQAYIGVQELQQLPANLAHRRTLAQRFYKALGRLELYDPAAAYLRLSLRVHHPERWKAAFADVLALGDWFSSVAHGRQSRLEDVRYRSGSCPTAEAYSRQTINFPTHRWMKEIDLDSFVQRILQTALKDDIIGPI